MASDPEAEERRLPGRRGGRAGAVLRRGLERLRPLAALRRDLPGGRGHGRRLELRRLLHHRAGQAHRAPLRQRRGGRVRRRGRGGGLLDRTDPPSRGRPVRGVPGGIGPRHLREGQRGAPAALVLPGAGGDRHLPAGRLPDGRQRAELEAAERAGDHGARPGQPSGGLPVRPCRARPGRGRRPERAARADDDRAPDRHGEPGRPAAVDRPGERARPAGSDSATTKAECGREGSNLQGPKPTGT